MKNRIAPFHIEKNAISDGGEGVVNFTKPVSITDDKEQWNGTKYDMESYDTSGYRNKLTANHSSDIEDIIGVVQGLKKDGNKITIDGIKFAVNENPLALFAYNMMLGGYLTDFSTETIGPYPNEEGIYKDAKLVNLSAVVIGNNKKAHVNEIEQIALNSLTEAKNKGLDVRNLLKLGIDNERVISNTIEEIMKFATITNSKGFPITVKYKNTAGADVELTLNAGQSFEVLEDQKTAVETQINNAVEPVKTDATTTNNSVNTDAIVAAVNAAINPLKEEVKKMKEEAFNKNATEPEFKNGVRFNVTGTKNKLADMSYKQRHAKQINLAWDSLKNHDAAANAELVTINEFNLEKLQEADIVDNSVSITDMGNFVISPELLKDIEGFRSNFKPFLSAFNFQETLSLQMAWLKRSGDISMEEVAYDPDSGTGTGLKPISEYGADFHTSNLKEVAAVTPVCNAATRFLAVDLLSDVAAGYRLDADRKKAQLVIARLQQAVNETGNNLPYVRTSATTGLTSWISVWSRIAELIGDGGVFIFNQKTKTQLLTDAIQAGINASVAAEVFKSGDFSPILGQASVIVPNELMPTLNTNETKSFTIDGATVTINKGVFYLPPAVFTGRTSGGLMYDLSTEAAYEQGGVVKSAYQRNELVLRGSMFRGGAVKDTAQVAAMGAQGVS